MPYDSRSPIAEQVHRSIRTSLHHLRPFEETGDDDSSVYIDTLVLHSPLPTIDQTLEAWSTAETYVPHRIRNLGISNCTLSELETLCLSPQVKVKPAVVQNRFYQNTRYDVPLRAFSRDHAIIYQSFWTLTANPGLLASSGPVGMLAQQAKISPQAALYGLVLGLGNTTVLNGTNNESHMAADLTALQIMQMFVSEQPDAWKQLLDRFKMIIGEPVL